MGRNTHLTLRCRLRFMAGSPLQHTNSAFFTERHQGSRRDRTYRLPVIVLNGMTKSRNSPLASLFTVEIAIATKCPHACAGSQAHCWMEVGIAKIGSKRFDYAILARCCQSSEDAILDYVIPRRPANQLYQLIDTASGARLT